MHTPLSVIFLYGQASLRAWREPGDMPFHERLDVPMTEEQYRTLQQPLRCLDHLVGWTPVNMWKARMLMRFVQTSTIIKIAMGVVYASLLAVPIQVTRTGDPVPEGRVQKARSRVWSNWLRDVAQHIDACGFCVCRYVPAAKQPENGDADLDLLPTIMPIDQLELFFQIDVDGDFQWRAFTATRRGAVAVGPAEELFHFQVYGRSVRDGIDAQTGTVYSKVQRLFDGDWQMLQSKQRLTLQADKERACPMLITQMETKAIGGGTSDAFEGGRVPSHAAPASGTSGSASDETPEEAARRMQQAAAIAADLNHPQTLETQLRVQDATCGTKTAEANGGGVVPGLHELPGRTQFVLLPGTQMASAPMSEAPQDLLPVRTGYHEMVLLTWSVPPPMVLSGDSTGKAKLNTASAGEEMTQVFRDSEEATRVWAEATVAQHAFHMYHEGDVLRRLEEVAAKRKRSKRKRHPTGGADADDSEEDDDIDLTSDPEANERDGLTQALYSKRACQWDVEIPRRQKLSEVMLLDEQGLLQEGARQRMLASHLGVSMSDILPTPHMTAETKQIRGVKVETAGAGAKKKAKSK